MTGYVDFRFTSASGWTDSANALSDRVQGAATTSAASGADTATLTLSAPSITFATDGSDPEVTGIQWDLSLSRSGSGGSGAEIDGIFMGCSVGSGTVFGAGDNFGEVDGVFAPIARTTFGGETNTNGFASGLTYAQFSQDLNLQITGTNTSAKTRTFYVWDVKGRVWLDVLSMQDVVQRAFRKVAVLSKDTTITGDDLTHGLDLLNDMMFGWAIFGVDVGHSERASGEAFPLARKFVEGTAAQLAERLSPDYQVPAPSADAFFRQLQAEYTTIAAAGMPRALTRMPSRYWRDTRVR